MVVFGPFYAILNGLLHFVVDFATSKVNAYLWAKNQRHWFFTNIGLDQSIHFSILYLTTLLL
jgi:hypothetical protein